MPATQHDDGDRLRAAREVVGLRSCKALVHHLAVDDDGHPVKGYSYGKLSKIESGDEPLAPQDAGYIAERLGLPRSFFTAPSVRLGDVTAGAEAEARPVTLRIVERPAGTQRKRGRRAGSPSEQVLPADPLAADAGAQTPGLGGTPPTSRDAASKQGPGRAPSRRKRA